MDWIELVKDNDRWDVRSWNGSSRIRIRTGGMYGYGIDRAALGYGQVGCAVMDWIELAQDTERWYVRLWIGSSWIRIRTGGMYVYGMDRGG